MDGLTTPAGHLGPHRSNDLEATGDIFQGLGNVVRDVTQTAAAVMAGCAWVQHDSFTSYG